MRIQVLASRLSVIFVFLAVAILTITSPQIVGSSTSFFRIWNNACDAGASGVTEGALGDIFVIGGTGCPYPQPTSLFLLKYDANGKLLWQKLWGNTSSKAKDDVGNSVAVDSVGNVYLTGTSRSFSASAIDQAILVKLDSSGNMLWQQTWGLETKGKTVAISSRGEIYLAVSPSYVYGSNGLILLKFDPAGKIIWQETWNHGFAESAAVAGDGSVYVTGETPYFDVANTTGSSNSQHVDAILVKFSSNGSLTWQRIWRVGNSREAGNSVIVDVFGNIYVAGSSFYGLTCPECPTTSVASITKFAANGTMLWHRSLPSTWRVPYELNYYEGYTASGINVDANGRVLVIGNHYGNTTMFSMSLDSNGSLLNYYTWAQAVAWGIADDVSGSPIVVGTVVPYPNTFGISHPSLNESSPLVAIPEAIIQNSSLISQNITGQIWNVLGKTAYSGSGDAFLSFGSAFPVSAHSTFQAVAVVVTTAVVAQIAVAFSRKRTKHTKVVD